MTKIKSVPKNWVPALLEMKKGSWVIEKQDEVGKGIQFKSNSVCLPPPRPPPSLGLLVGLVISKCKVSVSSSIFPWVEVVAWGKVTAFLFPHLFSRGCWFTFRMDKKGSVAWLMVYAAFHSMIPRLPVFQRSVPWGCTLCVDTDVLSWRGDQDRGTHLLSDPLNCSCDLNLSWV